MEQIFIVKQVGEMTTISMNTDTQPKRTVLLSSYIPRATENGIQPVEQSFMVDLIGERARTFSAQQGDLIAACLNFTVRSGQDRLFQNITLLRYVKLNE